MQPKRKAITTIVESFAPMVSPEKDAISVNKAAKKRRLKRLSGGSVEKNEESDNDVFEKFEGDDLITKKRVQFAFDVHVGRKEGAIATPKT